MDRENLKALLEEVRTGGIEVDAALDRLRHLPYEDLGFANIDHHREIRVGMPEVIFGKGKTAEEAMAALKERREAAQTQLEKLGANKGSVVCNGP